MRHGLLLDLFWLRFQCGESYEPLLSRTSELLPKPERKPNALVD